jgi:hypothetical protein
LPEVIVLVLVFSPVFASMSEPRCREQTGPVGLRRPDMMGAAGLPVSARIKAWVAHPSVHRKVRR